MSTLLDNSKVYFFVNRLQHSDIHLSISLISHNQTHPLGIINEQYYPFIICCRFYMLSQAYEEKTCHMLSASNANWSRLRSWQRLTACLLLLNSVFTTTAKACLLCCLPAQQTSKTIHLIIKMPALNLDLWWELKPHVVIIIAGFICHILWPDISRWNFISHRWCYSIHNLYFSLYPTISFVVNATDSTYIFKKIYM